MLDTIRTTIAPATENLTDGQYLGFGVLLVILAYVTVYMLVVKARRDDRVDNAARGIARLHNDEVPKKLRVRMIGEPHHGESRWYPGGIVQDWEDKS